MTYNNFIQQLEKQTSALSYERGLAMAIYLCRKLLSHFQVFLPHTGGVIRGTWKKRFNAVNRLRHVP